MFGTRRHSDSKTKSKESKFSSLKKIFRQSIGKHSVERRSQGNGSQDDDDDENYVSLHDDERISDHGEVNNITNTDYNRRDEEVLLLSHAGDDQRSNLSRNNGNRQSQPEMTTSRLHGGSGSGEPPRAGKSMSSSVRFKTPPKLSTEDSGERVPRTDMPEKQHQQRQDRRSQPNDSFTIHDREVAKSMESLGSKGLREYSSRRRSSNRRSEGRMSEKEGRKSRPTWQQAVKLSGDEEERRQSGSGMKQSKTEFVGGRKSRRATSVRAEEVENDAPEAITINDLVGIKPTSHIEKKLGEKSRASALKAEERNSQPSMKQLQREQKEDDSVEKIPVADVTIPPYRAQNWDEDENWHEKEWGTEQKHYPDGWLISPPSDQDKEIRVSNKPVENSNRPSSENRQKPDQEKSLPTKDQARKVVMDLPVSQRTTQGLSFLYLFSIDVL